jgi:hypothetical protein
MKLFSKKLKTSAVPKKAEDSLSNPKVLEVNLVKDEISVSFDWSKHLLSLVLTVLVAAFLIGEVYYGLDWWQKQEEAKTTAINTEYDDVAKQIKNIDYNSKDFTSFQDKLVITKKMADVHVYWTDFFDWLEAKTLNTVFYRGFSGDISGDYSLNAETDNFSDISWQVENLKKDPYVLGARVDSGNFNRPEKDADTNKITPSKVTFSLNLQVKPGIFYRQAE